MSAIIDTLIATLQAAPDSWQCRLALVEALINEDRVDEAHAALAQVTELPEDIESQMMAGKAYGLLDPESGNQIFDGIIASSPQHAPAVYAEKARLFFASGDIEQATNLYNGAIGLNPALADPGFAAQLQGGQAAVAAPEPVAPPEMAAAPVQAVPLVAEPEPEPEPEVIAEAVPLVAEPEPVLEAQPAPVAVEPEPEVELVVEEVQAAPAVAAPVPIAPPQAVAPPPPPAAAPVEEYQPLDRSQVYFPAPGEYPTMTLREALSLQGPAPLIDPNSVPELPELAYQEEVEYAETNYVSEEEYYSQLNNVEVHTAEYEEGVTYNYQEPDDTIFEPTVTEDDIYVSALVTEGGEAVANLQENIRRNKAAKDEERKKKERAATIQSIAIGIVAVVLVGVLLGMVVQALPRPAPPQITASVVAPSNEPTIEKPTMTKSTPTPTPAAASASMSMDVMTVASASSISMQSFDAPTMDLGAMSMTTDFGSSMSFGDQSGGGSVMFFGGKSTGKRFLFVLDASASMKPEQIKLRDDELEKTLKSLKNVEYQVLLFAGGAYFAEKGWGVDPKSKGPSKGETKFFSPKGDYTFKEHHIHTYELDDDKGFVPPDWKKSSASAVRRTMEIVKTSKKFVGTDWDNAIELGLRMDPPPDVVFFMSDGLDNKLDIDEISRINRKAGKPKINCVAMQTSKGQPGFSGIAEKSRGSYTIVDKDGEPIDGFDYMKDPASFADRVPF